MPMRLIDIGDWIVPTSDKCLAFVEAHGIVPSGARRGALSFHYRPYQRHAYSVMDDPEVEEIVMPWCSQSGKSTVVLNVLQYWARNRPTNAMIAFPNKNSRNDFVQDRLQRAIMQVPGWERELEKCTDPIVQNKARYRNSAHYFALQGSDADLAQRDCELVIIDEADKAPEKVGRETSPEKQIAARTRTFYRAKEIHVGTPTIRNSPLDRKWKSSNQHRMHVACPGCGQHFFWEISRLEWEARPVEDGGQMRSMQDHAEAISNGSVKVWYEAPCCGHRIEQDQKDELNKHAIPIAIRPAVKRVFGFTVTAFDIPDESFQSIAAEYLRAKHDEEHGREDSMQFFQNHYMATTYFPKRKVIREEAIASRVTDIAEGVVPEGFDFVTVGADAQNNRIYWIAAAWRIDPFCCHVVDFGEIRAGGDEAEQTGDIPKMLTANLVELNRQASRRVFRGTAWEGLPRAIGVDSGSPEHMRIVYRWAIETGAHCYATKGHYQKWPNGDLFRRSSTKNEDHEGRLVLLCPVNTIDMIAAFFNYAPCLEPGKRSGLTFCRKAGADADLQKQLVSKHKVAGKWEFRDGYPEDHYLDAFRGAVGMAALCGISRPTTTHKKLKARPVARRFGSGPYIDPFGRRL